MPQLSRSTWRILLAVILTWGGVKQAPAVEAPPNLILILADDLGATDLGCYGADLHQTPRLDRLAREGVRFRQGYAAAPVCTPSRAALLTGHHPARLHLTIWREASVQRAANEDFDGRRQLVTPATAHDLPFAELTLAERLRERGYLTFHVGKWHLGDAGSYPEAHGFDLNLGGTHWGAPASYFFPYRGEGRFRDGMRYVPGLGLGQPEDYLTDELTTRALELIDAAGERPFFLNLWHYGVHTPLQAPAADVERCQGRLQPELNHQNPTYAAMVENLDHNVGRLLDHLAARGLAERTLVVFTSDNGGFLGRPEGPRVTSNAPLRSGKGSLYEGGLRVPLVMRWPGRLSAGTTCDQPLAHVDLYATLLEALGAADPADPAVAGDGRSGWPWAREPERGIEPRDLFFHYPHYYSTTTPASAVRSGNLKLVHYYEGNRDELFDLAADPAEEHDLAGERPEQARSLRTRLDAWLHEVGAQLPSERGTAP